MADMDRSAIVLLAREHAGITDASKGGPNDAALAVKLNHVLDRMCLLAEAPRTVYYLSTKFNDKYLPLDDQLLWISKVVFIPPTGTPYELDLVDGAIFPTTNGNPRVYWHTAVNVPDVNGRSTPTLGLHPIPQIVGADKNVRVDVFQKIKPLTGPTDVPELVSVLHQYLAAGLALDILMLFPDRYRKNGPQLEVRFREGVNMLRLITHGAAKNRAAKSSDVQRYTTILSNRV
jgi:hypothetical protein